MRKVQEVVAYIGDKEHDIHVAIDGRELTTITGVSVAYEVGELPTLTLRLVGVRIAPLSEWLAMQEDTNG